MSEKRVCPVCGSAEHVLFMSERIIPEAMNAYSYASRKEPEYMCHELVRCCGCNLIYAIQPPSGEELSRAYGEADYDSSEEALCAAQSYADVLRPLVRTIPHGLAVDVGAGNGTLLPFFQQMGFQSVLGIEPSHSAVLAAPTEIRPFMREEMFSRDSLEGKSPSLICSFMTLEHLADPDEFTHTAFDLLEAGGMLAVVVHNYQALLNRLLGQRSPIIDIEHLQLFCPQAVETLFQRAGFQHIHVIGIRNRYPLRYWLRLAPIPAFIKRKLFHKAGTGSFCEPFFSWKIACNVGNIMVVGRKPD